MRKLDNEAALAADDAPLWAPSAERRRRALVTRFGDWLARERGLVFDSYETLWQWSVSDAEGFWSAVLAFFDLPLRTPRCACSAPTRCRVPSGSRARA